MLPDRRDQHQVKRQAEAMDLRQCRQPVIEPADRRVRMPAHSFGAHTRRRFDRHDLIAPARQPGSIAARAAPDIERKAVDHGFGKQSQDRIVHMEEVGVILAAGKLDRLCVIDSNRPITCAHGKVFTAAARWPASQRASDRRRTIPTVPVGAGTLISSPSLRSVNTIDGSCWSN